MCYAENIGQILRTAFHLGVASVIGSWGPWDNLRGRALWVSMGWCYHMDFHLADPLAVLKRRDGTGLRDYWSYVPGGNNPDEGHREYSQLMSSSLALISDHILDTVPLGDYHSLVDVAGGTGHFASLVTKRHPHIAVSVLDLPEVVSEAKLQRHNSDIRFVATDMFRSPLPQDVELFSLIRVLHDHDDEPISGLLSRLCSALKKGGQLLIAEPMAGTPGAEPIGDTYFSFYLWAMGSGRPRTAEELTAMCLAAGFSAVREFKTPIPALTRVLIAEKGGIAESNTT